MTTYFVSGFMRTGTSMMMQALEAGGMDAAYDKSRDENTAEPRADEFYHPNGGGLYELIKRKYDQPDFPTGYEGRLIKALHGGILKIISGNYKIVFMRRNFEEIRQSYEAFFGEPPRMSEEWYLKLMERSIGILNERRDCDVTVLWYRGVLADPALAFTLLRECGWPIDVDKAVAVVDPEQCRFRLENLEVGA